MIKKACEALKEIGGSFNFEPFAGLIQGIIEEVLT